MSIESMFDNELAATTTVTLQKTTLRLYSIYQLHKTWIADFNGAMLVIKPASG